jgi:MADS-box transcription factor
VQPGSVNIDDMFKAETGLDDDDDDDGDGECLGTADAVRCSCADAEATPHAKRPRVHADQPGGFTYVDKDGEAGRRKIRIEYISDKSRRHITFSKRKAGIMKKVSGIWAKNRTHG